MPHFLQYSSFQAIVHFSWQRRGLFQQKSDRIQAKKTNSVWMCYIAQQLARGKEATEIISNFAGMQTPSSCSDDSIPQGVPHQFCDRVNLKLSHEICPMSLCRLCADGEELSGLTAVFPFGNQAQQLPLSSRERFFPKFGRRKRMPIASLCTEH